MLACATISKNEYECPGDSLRDLLDAANSDMQGKFEQAQLKYAEDIAAAVDVDADGDRGREFSREMFETRPVVDLIRRLANDRAME